jgi:peroxiredoxin
MDLGFDVVDLGEADHPAEGDTAPDFVRPLVNDEYWEDASLADLAAEGPVLLIFHPMNGAFPATYIWNELRDRDFADYDAAIVGLSISTPYAHKDFIADRNVEDFRFFSDPANDVAEEYGIVNDLDGMAGIEEPRPATFVMDEDRTIEYAWVADQWPAFPDYDDLEAALDDVTE